MADARETAADRVGDARDAAAERMVDARDAAASASPTREPRRPSRSRRSSRGCAASPTSARSSSRSLLGAGLIVARRGREATLAAAIYAVSLSALFGVSALYHRVDWKRPEARRWMRRLDHTMIFFLIAGTVTPFALLVMDGAAGDRAADRGLGRSAAPARSSS